MVGLEGVVGGGGGGGGDVSPDVLLYYCIIEVLEYCRRGRREEGAGG